MSGWDVQSLYGSLFGLFLIALGLLQLFDPLPVKSASGRTDLQREQPRDWWLAFIFFGAGALHLLLPNSSAPAPILPILMGAFLLAMVVWGLLAEPYFEARRLRRYEAELARLAAGADSYSDELRTLQANPPGAMAPRRRLLLTVLFTLFGGAFLALGLATPR